MGTTGRGGDVAPVKQLQDNGDFGLDAALEEYGLTWDIVREALNVGRQSTRRYTAAALPNSKGSAIYHESMQALIHSLVERGWSLDRGWQKIISPDRSIALSVKKATDVGTRRSCGPCVNISKRSKEAINASDENSDLTLFGPSTERDPAKKSLPKPVLILVESESEKLKVEVAEPLTVETDGSVTSWKNRVILPIIERRTIRTFGDEDGNEDESGFGISSR